MNRHVYLAAAVAYSLTVSSACGVGHETAATVSDYDATRDPLARVTGLAAEFSVCRDTIRAGDVVSFFDESVPAPTAWSWQFPGGAPATSSDQYPTVTYDQAGSFDVTLTVSDGTESATLTKSGMMTVLPKPTYCTAAASAYDREWIRSVEIGDFSNPSAASGYSDFTTLSPMLDAGVTYQVRLVPGHVGCGRPEYWRVWIDYNGDYDFTDPGEVVFRGYGRGIVTGAFKVRARANGFTYLRVSMRHEGVPAACGESKYGEVEDYSVLLYNAAAKLVDVTPAEAADLIASHAGNPSFVVLDVRTPDEFAAERLQDAVNIDFRSPSFDAELAKLNKDKVYLVYCRTGSRSALAMERMRLLELQDVGNLLGGITSWKAEGYPVVR